MKTYRLISSVKTNKSLEKHRQLYKVFEFFFRIKLPYSIYLIVKLNMIWFSKKVSVRFEMIRNFYWFYNKRNILKYKTNIYFIVCQSLWDKIYCCQISINFWECTEKNSVLKWQILETKAHFTGILTWIAHYLKHQLVPLRDPPPPTL